MIKLRELRKGSYVFVNAVGKIWQGEVTDFNKASKLIGIDNGVQEFYHTIGDLSPIVVDENMLLKMNFKKHVNDDGSVKYMKGAFRMQLPKQDDFSRYEIWYKDEIRQILSPIYLHTLQNHYEDLTKMKLTDQAI